MGLLGKLRETKLSAVDLEKYRDKITQIPSNTSLDGSFDPNTNSFTSPHIVKQSFLSRFSLGKRESYIDSLSPIPVIDQRSLTNNGIATSTENTTNQPYSSQDYMEEDYA